MNKKVVNNWLAPAIDAIKHTEIVDKDGDILKTYRGQISTFGTAIVMGSLKAAVAFFTGDSQSDVDREKLLLAMYYIINGMKSKDEIAGINGLYIFNWICQNDTAETKEKFINASIALKLAMNFYNLIDEKTAKDKKKAKEAKEKRGENSEES